MQTKSGYLAKTKMKPSKGSVTDLACLFDEGTKMDIMEFHNEIGHPSEEITMATAKSMNVKITGSWRKCLDCEVGKSRVKDITKSRIEDGTKSTYAGERLDTDIRSVKTVNLGEKEVLEFMDRLSHQHDLVQFFKEQE